MDFALHLGAVFDNLTQVPSYDYQMHERESSSSTTDHIALVNESKHVAFEITDTMVATSDANTSKLTDT